MASCQFYYSDLTFINGRILSLSRKHVCRVSVARFPNRAICRLNFRGRIRLFIFPAKFGRQNRIVKFSAAVIDLSFAAILDAAAMIGFSWRLEVGQGGPGFSPQIRARRNFGSLSQMRKFAWTPIEGE